MLPYSELLAYVDIVNILNTINLGEVPDGNAIAVGNISQRIAITHGIIAAAGTTTAATTALRNAQSLPNIDIVWITDAVEVR